MNYETALALWCIAGFCLNCAISFWVNKKLVVLDLVMCAIGSAIARRSAFSAAARARWA